MVACSQVQWWTPVIPELGRFGWEDLLLQACLCYMVGSCVIKPDDTVTKGAQALGDLSSDLGPSSGKERADP